ncbi:MAG: S26 family signal peptidase [Marinilabiliaceae bacterium]
MVKRKATFSWRGSKYSIAFAVVVIAAAVWVRAYELIPPIALASWAYIRTDTFVRLAQWVEAHTPMSRALLSWGLAALFATGAVAYVMCFIAELGVYTTPDHPRNGIDNGTRLCLVSKVKYGVARNEESPDGYYRTHRVGAIRRGDHALTSTPAGVIIQRIVAKPGDTVRVADAALYVNGDNDADTRHAVATFCLNKRVAYADLRTLKQANEDLGDYAKTDTLPRGITFRDGHTAHADTTATRLPVRRRLREWAMQTFAPMQPNLYDVRCYPHSPAYLWNAYQWGPMRLPRKGDVMALTYANVALYGPMVKEYEGVTLHPAKGQTYKFKMSYYMTLCDDRDVLCDSRSFGPIPESKVMSYVAFF